MKLALIAAALITMTGTARAADKPPEFSQAFCAGFNAAVALEKTRFDNWSTVTMAGIAEGDPAKQTNVAKTAVVIVRSVPLYVLLQPLNGRVDIGGGAFVDCAHPAPEPAK